MNKDEPAFPEASPTNWAERQKGMALRDYFAGQALVGLIANPNMTDKELARYAYAAADAMLTQRERKGWY